MELLKDFIDLFLHLDKHLLELVTQYHAWIYAILFLIIFLETGVVITPILPGDSLLFAAGAIAAVGSMNIWILVITLCVAAIMGDTVNYWIGRYMGEKVYERNYRLISRKHILRTKEFYEKHGGKTIVIARFIPIIRTFAPFIAGVGTMAYKRFITFNITGGILWVAAFCSAGYFFGNIPAVKRNFSLVILAIIIISVVPVVIGYFRGRKGR